MLSAGKLPWVVLKAMRESDRLQRIACACARVLDGSEIERELRVLQSGQVV